MNGSLAGFGILSWGTGKFWANCRVLQHSCIIALSHRYDTRACSKTLLVLDKLLEKPVKSPVFPLNLRKLFQNLTFWNSLE
jgi:hypothetical protein